MAVKQASVTVGTTATLLTNTGKFGGGVNTEVTVENSHATEALHVGGSGVTVSDGVRIAAGGTRTFTVAGNEELYAVAGGTGSSARVVVAPVHR